MPPAHGLQADWFVTEYIPALQTVHCDAPIGATEPVAHFSQSPPAVDAVPTPQVEQAEAPLDEELPAWQGEHDPASFSEYVPAEHSVGAVAPSGA